MKTFYVTVAKNQPFGEGYFEVEADSRDEAHEKAMKTLDGKWSMLYENLEDIHPLDRKRHGRF